MLDRTMTRRMLPSPTAKLKTANNRGPSFFQPCHTPGNETVSSRTYPPTLRNCFPSDDRAISTLNTGCCRNYPCGAKIVCRQLPDLNISYGNSSVLCHTTLPTCPFARFGSTRGSSRPPATPLSPSIRHPNDSNPPPPKQKQKPGP